MRIGGGRKIEIFGSGGPGRRSSQKLDFKLKKNGKKKFFNDKMDFKQADRH
jgi:hypothetical protein